MGWGRGDDDAGGVFGGVDDVGGEGVAEELGAAGGGVFFGGVVGGVVGGLDGG